MTCHATERRRAIRAAIGVLFALAAGTAAAQGYPMKPIRLLVPLAAGSTADIVSRFAGLELGKAIGQPVVVENKPGAGGTIAMAELARSAPDGYTIAFASQGTLVFNQAIYAKPGYDSVKDFAPVSFVGGVSNVMIVPPKSEATKPLDIVAAAKAKPGELTFSSGGAGTSHHLSGVLFGQVTDTKLVHVPYKGAPQGVQAVMAGEVAMGFFNTPTVISQIKGGLARPLGVTSLKRSPLLPDVPTLDEQGIKGYEVNTWFGEAEKVAFVMSNIQNHIAGTGGPGGADIRLVVHGPALKNFHALVADENFTKVVEKVRKDGVGLDACANTMRVQGVKLDDLLPGFVVAEKGGVVRLVELQQQGYAYLRP